MLVKSITKCITEGICVCSCNVPVFFNNIQLVLDPTGDSAALAIGDLPSQLLSDVHQTGSYGYDVTYLDASDSDALNQLQAKGLVEFRTGNRVQLSKSGSTMFSVSITLRNPTPVFQIRPLVPIDQMTNLEVVLKLKSDGWVYSPNIKPKNPIAAPYTGGCLLRLDTYCYPRSQQTIIQ